MRHPPRRIAALLVVALLGTVGTARAETEVRPPTPAPADHTGHAGHSAPATGADHSAHAGHAGHTAPAGADHSAHADHGDAALGPYPASREASGTAWQPDSASHEGLHLRAGGWRFMLHGWVDGIWDNQAGPRGSDKFFSASMLMGMAQRRLGPGMLAFRVMLSLDPLMGPSGYPLLLQTGETADGKTPLIDRQHPHDLFMELSVSYSLAFAGKGSVFAYFGLPGEPALGPAAFMHRLSALALPEAPITHHWLDSTHVTFGVITIGVVWDRFKLEGSAFRGREPDQHRYDIERPSFDSFSGRLTWNPLADLSAQVSYGHLKSPEQLEPDVSQHRITASATYHHNFRSSKLASETTLAWGRNIADVAQSTLFVVTSPPNGRATDGFLLESTLKAPSHTVTVRAERVTKDELFRDGNPLFGRPFTVNKVSLGYVYDLPVWAHHQWGIGGLASLHLLPHELDAAYGPAAFSAMLFLRLQLR